MTNPVRGCAFAALAIVAAACRVERAPSGRPSAPAAAAPRDTADFPPADSAAIREVEAVLREHYARFSARDFAAWRRTFWPDGVIATRGIEDDGRARMFFGPVEGFERDLEPEVFRLAVFSEDPLAMHIRTYDDVAQAWVIFRSRSGITPAAVYTYNGLDAFQLMKHEGRWRITSAAFTQEVPGRPLAVPR
jgi:hypothetical protein